LVGKNWVWDGDYIHQCKWQCLLSQTRVCESKGSVSSTAEVKSQVLNCRKLT
jgi:hypothetical protein